MAKETYDQLRNRHKIEFADYLQKSADVRNPHEFQGILEGAILYGPGHNAIRAFFNVAESTLRRWRSGASMPPEGTRIGFVIWMRERILSTTRRP